MAQRPNWTSQPQDGTRLDPSISRNAGMLRAIHAPATLLDIAGNATLGLESDVSFTANRAGKAYEFNGSTSGLTIPIAVTGPFTITVLGETSTLSGTRNFCSLGQGSAYAVQLRQDGTSWSYYQYDVVDKLIGESATVAVNTPVLLHAVWDGFGTAKLYRSGIERASVSVTTVRAIDTLKIGQDNFGAKQALAGKIYYLSVQSLALSASDVAADAVNLWARFTPRRRLVFDVASMPSTFNPAWAVGSNIMIGAGVAL